MRFSIYTLSNPVTEEIFYVGCTTNIERRIAEHRYSVIRSCSRRGAPLTAKDCYVLQLMQDPICHVIDEVDGDMSDGLDRENFWIAVMVELGFPIVNMLNREYANANLADVGDFIRLMSRIKPIEVKHIAA